MWVKNNVCFPPSINQGTNKASGNGGSLQQSSSPVETGGMDVFSLVGRVSIETERNMPTPKPKITCIPFHLGHDVHLCLTSEWSPSIISHDAKTVVFDFEEVAA